MTAFPGLAAEPTAIGWQTLVPGVSPISVGDRFAFRAAAPLCPIKPQKPCDIGLFDEAARNQLDLFIHAADARAASPRPDQLPPSDPDGGRGSPSK